MAKRASVKREGPLASVRSRIREAERAQAPVVREAIGIDEASYVLLAELVERGVGKKVDVLRQALATGLRVLHGAEAPSQPSSGIEQATPSFGMLAPVPTVQVPDDTSGLLAAVVGRRSYGPSIDVPPSQERAAQDGEGGGAADSPEGDAVE